MRTAPLYRVSFFGLMVALASMAGGVARAAETTSSRITITAQVYSRTALRVSTDELYFDAGEPNAGPVASVEFDARARIPSGTDIVLTVQPIDAAIGQDPTTITFAGVGAGTRAGTLSAAVPATAGRWTGSGRRSGRLLFTLCNARPGVYTVPVRFVLSAP